MAPGQTAAPGPPRVSYTPPVVAGEAPPPPPPPPEPRPYQAELFYHLASSLNDKTRVLVADEADPADGAHHAYDVHTECPDGSFIVHEIRFQHGGMNDVGANGISEEALLAILLHRAECFQRGKYACRENAQARSRIQEALMWLKERTYRRLAEGTEGRREKDA